MLTRYKLELSEKTEPKTEKCSHGTGKIVGHFLSSMIDVGGPISHPLWVVILGCIRKLAEQIVRSSKQLSSMTVLHFCLELLP